jgi:hypothetical protein
MKVVKTFTKAIGFKCSAGPIPIFVVLFKVLGVAFVRGDRYDGRIEFAVRESAPIDALEPLVALYVFGAAAQVAKASAAIRRQQAANQILRVAVKVRRKVNSARQNLFVDAKRIVVKEGRIAGQHLKQKYAQRPPIDRLVVTLRLNNLGRQILGRAAQRPRSILNALAKAKICYLDMPFGIKQ